jgi:serine phosphatase RsbU (regulator of sigma subunit)/FixJ family two-component response regulator
MVGMGDYKPRLMVVDDESDNLALLYRTFRRDFDVFRAESGFEALEILEKEGEMAVIISDQRMPKMTGIDFLSRTVDRFPDTMRIILTGYTDVQDLVEAINTGKVFKYITKPWDADELRMVVQQASETYRAIKQRTSALSRALRRESLLNGVMTAIRESLDYRSMLQTIVETLGQAFLVEGCTLYPVETPSPHAEDRNGKSGDRPPTLNVTTEVFSYWVNGTPSFEDKQIRLQPEEEAILQSVACDRTRRRYQSNSGRRPTNWLIVPLVYQKSTLAVLVLYKTADHADWQAEDLQLIEGVAEQAALAISQAKLYQRIQEQTEQMRAELAVARQIQSNLLRQSWPDWDNVRIQACCHPAREVGGDFFEVYTHPQGDIWLAVGDVSGKGVPAALFMASAISVLRRELSQETPPAPNILMQNLNSSLLDNLVSSNCFITMVLACYSPSSRELVYANAGHVYPLVWSQRQVTAQLAQADVAVTVEPNYLQVRGVPLGILPVWQAEAGRLSLDPGDVVLLTSDGITEARGHPGDAATASGNRMLRQAGLWRLIVQESSLNLNSVLAQIRAYNGVQEDDQTILSLEVL